MLKLCVFLIILIAGIQAENGFLTKSDVNNWFNKYEELYSPANMSAIADAYQRMHYETLAEVVRTHTFTQTEYDEMKAELATIPLNSNVNNDERLAMIANKYSLQTVANMFLPIPRIFDEILKERALFLAFKHRGNQTDAIKNAVIELAKVNGSEKAVNVDALYQNIYVFRSEPIVLSETLIERRVDLIKQYKTISGFFSQESMAKFEKIGKENAEIGDKAELTAPLNSEGNVEAFWKLVPTIVKLYDDLENELKSAGIECNYVRCRKIAHNSSHNLEAPFAVLVLTIVYSLISYL